MLYAHLTIQASRIGDVVALGSLGVPPAVKYPHILLCRLSPRVCGAPTGIYLSLLYSLFTSGSAAS